jgi:hypothetical protein
MNADLGGWDLVILSPDGRRLATCSDEQHMVDVWDLPVTKPWPLILAVALVPAALLAGLATLFRGRLRRTPRSRA